MPIVHAYISDSAMEGAHWGNLDTLSEQLFRACGVIVTSALDSSEGPLDDGDITYIRHPYTNGRWLNADILLEIEAFEFDDRVMDFKRRGWWIENALTQVFSDPGICHFVSGDTLKIKVWLKPVLAAYSTDADDPEFKNETPLDDAIDRACKAMFPDLGRSVGYERGPRPPKAKSHTHTYHPERFGIGQDDWGGPS